MTELTLDTRVITESGERGVIVAIAKGWYSVEIAGTIHKFRAKQLEVAPKATQAETLAKYREGYVVSITPSGRKSQKSATSAVGRIWEACDFAQVAQWTSLLLELPIETHINRYKRLNNGQIRMNCGNLVNARVKKGEITEEQMIEIMDAELMSAEEVQAVLDS